MAWLHLAVLWAFAVAQPLFNVLADDPAFFVARGNTSGDILLLAFGLVLVPPTVMVAVEALALRAPAVRRAIHIGFMALLAGVFALQVLADASPEGSSALLIPLALALGAVFGLAYWRTRLVPSMLTVLSPAPALFLALFLLFSDVSKLVLPESAQTAEASVRGDTPVVFVVFDEFSGLHMLGRDGQIDKGRFPNFAALGRRSTWYRNATTVTDHTSRAVPAILSAERSSNDKLPILGDYPDNLFTLLGGSYDLDVRETVSHMCPDSLCERELEPTATRLRSLARDLRIVSLRRLLPDDLASGLPAVNRTFESFQGSTSLVGGAVKGAAQSSRQARGRSFDSFIRGIGAGDPDRTLHFDHILLPHFPWLFLPSGQQYSENGRPVPGLNTQNDTWEKVEWSPHQAFQRYLLQAQFVDRLLGRLVAQLRKVGLYDRALVVVMADHGVSFRPGDIRRKVTQTNFADLASIPLFIKAPGQTNGRTVETPATSVDVLPTVADLLGIETPWKTDGISLRDRARSPSEDVRVAPAKGEIVERSFRDFVRQRDAFVTQFVDLFPGGERGLFGTPDSAGLTGRPTSAFPVTRRSGARAEVDASQSLASVDPQGPVLPAFVTGRLTGVDVGEKLAVALNGRIVSTAYCFTDRGQPSFAALVPPSAFRRGANRIQVFSVHDSGTSTTLAALGQPATDSFELSEEGGGQVLRSASGKEVRVKDGAVVGVIGGVDLLPGGVSVRGWAAVPDRAPADLVVVFVKGRLVAQGAPTEDRVDVAKDRGSGTLKSGFVLSGNDPEGSTPSRSDIKVFAIYGTEASELHAP